MSSEGSGVHASSKTLISDRNSDHSGSPRVSPHVCNHESSLSFPIKRSAATLHEPPSVFENSSPLKRSSKKPHIRQDTPSKRSHNNSTNSTDVNVEHFEDDIDNQKKTSVDVRDDPIVDNDPNFRGDQRRFHKKKRKEKEHKRSSKKRLCRKANKNEDEEEKNGNEESRKCGKRKIKKSPVLKALVAAYSSDDGNEPRSHKRLFPATLPRTHTVSSPVVRSERNKPSNSTSSPCATAPALVTKVTKGTAKSTWDSSDSDFEESIAKPSTPLAVILKSTKTITSNNEAEEKSLKDHSTSLKRSRSRGLSRTASSESASSSCSSRRRSYSSRSYSSRQRSYSTLTSASSSSRSSSRSYSHHRRSRYHGHRRRGRHYHRRLSTRSSYSRESSSSSSRERGSRRRRRYSHSSDSYRRRPSYRSYSSRGRRGRYTSSERSCTPNSRGPSRTPPAVCRHTINRNNSGSVVTVAGVAGSTNTCLSRQSGNKSSFIRGHKPSEAVAAVASAAVRKITGRSEPSPSSTPPALSKDEGPDANSENNVEVTSQIETDSSYIGPQVPPDMARKLGLNVDSSTSSATPSSNTISASNNGANNNWKAHVGAKRKSEKTTSENTKKPEEIKSEFMTPPEKDDQYKALQEQAKEHVRQQMQQAQLHANQRQQFAAAVASVAANQTATTAPVAMLPGAVGHLSVIDQLRQRQQIYLLSGAMDQAIVLENIIRQHQQVEVANALQQQQQQTLQMLALQQHQQNGILAAQQHQVQSAQQAALLLAAQQHQAAASQTDSTGAATIAAQQQQAVMQTFLQQRQQQALAVAAQQQQQQQIQMLLQMKVQQQAAVYANAMAAAAAASNVAIAPSPQAVQTSTTATANSTSNGAISGSEAAIATGTDIASSQSPTVLAAMAAAHRNQAFHQEQLHNQINAAALVSANATGMVLTQQQQQRQQLLALQAAAVAAQQPSTAPQPATSPSNLSAVQQQIAAAALYHQQQQQQVQNQQQQHAVALLLAAQQSRMLRPP